MLNKRGIITVLLCAAWAGTVPASAQSPEDVALDAVRTRSSVPPDEAAIDNWITYQIKKLREDLAVGSTQADDEFLQAYNTQCNHAENSASFKTRFGEQTSRRFAAEFEKGQGLEVKVGLVLARTLAGMNDLGSLGALSAGLTAKGQPGVRYTCAKVFSALRPGIQADAGQTARTIGLLRDAGALEQSGVVRVQIYDALFYRDTNLEAAVEAILDVVKGQLRMRGQGAPACDGAEQAAFNFLRTELNNIQDKGRLVAVLAAYLRSDTERYLTKGVSDEERYLIELTVDVAESLLARVVALTGPAPNIREAMKHVVDRDINMPLELNKWIGTAQTKGVLNGPPWNVTVGAPIPD